MSQQAIADMPAKMHELRPSMSRQEVLQTLGVDEKFAAFGSGSREHHWLTYWLRPGADLTLCEELTGCTARVFEVVLNSPSGVYDRKLPLDSPSNANDRP
jgi:hypothetical protein